MGIVVIVGRVGRCGYVDRGRLGEGDVGYGGYGDTEACGEGEMGHGVYGDIWDMMIW